MPRPLAATARLLDDPIAHFPQATVACFDPTCGALPRRQLDAPRTVDFLERLVTAGATSLLIGASTGQGHLRTPAELEAWLGVAAQARTGPALRMALLRPEDGTITNRRLCPQLAAWGYAVAFVRPGSNLPPTATAAEIASNMQPVIAAAAAAGLAVGVYSIPDVSGVRLTPAACEILQAGPGGEHLVAVKITEADYQRSTLEFLQSPALRRWKVVQGWDPFLSQALQDGPRFDEQHRPRCGITSGPMSFAVYQYLHLLQAASAADWEEVRQSQAAVTQLFQAMQDDPHRFADLQRAKYIMGLGQPLLAEVSTAQVERVLTALQSLPRAADRQRLARSFNLLGKGPCQAWLHRLADDPGP